MSTIIQKIAGRLAETKQVFLHGLPEKSGISVPRFDVRMGGQFLYQKRLFEKIHNLEGDVVECGVGHGKSFLAWCYLLLDEGAHRKVWGFDSFAGFPEPRKEDSSPRKPQKGDWSGVGLPEMSAMLLGGGLPKEWFYSHATLVEGFFDKSLPKFTGKKIALLHLDVDLYGSYRVALERLYDRVVPGGIVAFDEYMGTNEHFKFPGAKKAIDEYLAETGKKISMCRDEAWGKYYIVKPEI